MDNQFNMKTNKLTICQQLNIKVNQDKPFEIKNQKGQVIYLENYKGEWYRNEFDLDGNRVYYENFDGYWLKNQFEFNNENNITIYHIDSEGGWFKKEYNQNNKLIYLENSDGIIIDKRPRVEITLEEIAKVFGIKVENLKIKN